MSAFILFYKTDIGYSLTLTQTPLPALALFKSAKGCSPRRPQDQGFQALPSLAISLPGVWRDAMRWCWLPSYIDFVDQGDFNPTPSCPSANRTTLTGHPHSDPWLSPGALSKRSYKGF